MDSNTEQALAWRTADVITLRNRGNEELEFKMCDDTWKEFKWCKKDQN